MNEKSRNHFAGSLASYVALCKLLEIPEPHLVHLEIEEVD